MSEKSARRDEAPKGWMCARCGVDSTIMRRNHPNHGPGSVCNACGLQYNRTHKAMQRKAFILATGKKPFTPTSVTLRDRPAHLTANTDLESADRFAEPETPGRKTPARLGGATRNKSSKKMTMKEAAYILLMLHNDGAPTESTLAEEARQSGAAVDDGGGGAGAGAASEVQTKTESRSRSRQAHIEHAHVANEPSPGQEPFGRSELVQLNGQQSTVAAMQPFPGFFVKQEGSVGGGRVGVERACSRGSSCGGELAEGELPCSAPARHGAEAC